jgi:hypothetical protein
MSHPRIAVRPARRGGVRSRGGLGGRASRGVWRVSGELDDLASARAAVRSLPMLDLPMHVDVPYGGVDADLAAAGGAGDHVGCSRGVVAMGALGCCRLARTRRPPWTSAKPRRSSLRPRLWASSDDGSEVPALLVAGDDARYRARQTYACRDDGRLGGCDRRRDRIGEVTVMSDPLSGLTVLGIGSVRPDRSKGRSRR